MTATTWEVKAKLYMRGFLVVGGILQRTDSHLMFKAKAYPRHFRNTRWSVPLSDVVAVSELQRFHRPVLGFFLTRRVEIQTKRGVVVIWLKDPARLLGDSLGASK